MSKPKTVVTEREVRLARAFLHAMMGDEANGYLLLAVIAWMRLMKKAHDPFWQSMARFSPVAAGKMLAKRLRDKMHARPSDYKHLATLLRRRTKGDAQVEAAKSFMLIIETSKYDAKHYGYTEGKDGYYKWDPGNPHLPAEDRVGRYVWVPAVSASDPMLDAWTSLTGHPIPPKWFNDPIATTKAVPEKPVPAQPRSLQHVQPKGDYILPYAAQHFYEERPHLGENVLPQD